MACPCTDEEPIDLGAQVLRQAAETTSVEINTLVCQFRIFFFWLRLLGLSLQNKWNIIGMKSNLISPVILPKLLIAWGLNPGRLGAIPTPYFDTFSLISKPWSIYN